MPAHDNSIAIDPDDRDGRAGVDKFTVGYDIHSFTVEIADTRGP